MATQTDTRTPSPPFGYSKECEHTRDQQIHIVAEFHAHKIRPSRIAYRVGIDIAFVEALIAGEEEAAYFDRLVSHYRKQRFAHRMKDAARKKGAAQYQMQQKIEKEFLREREL